MTRHADPEDVDTEQAALDRGDKPPQRKRDPWVRPGSQVTAETIREFIEQLRGTK
jgi:hypothetical protein